MRSVLGGVGLKGSVVNSTAKPHSYQIVVDFVTVPGSSVLTTSVVNVAHVHAGAKRRLVDHRRQGNPSCCVPDPTSAINLNSC